MPFRAVTDSIAKSISDSHVKNQQRRLKYQCILHQVRTPRHETRNKHNRIKHNSLAWEHRLNG